MGYSSVSHRHSASQAADGQGGALTFQSAVPHPLVRASKLLSGRRHRTGQYQPQFGQL